MVERPLVALRLVCSVEQYQKLHVTSRNWQRNQLEKGNNIIWNDFIFEYIYLKKIKLAIADSKVANSIVWLKTSWFKAVISRAEMAPEVCMQFNWTKLLNWVYFQILHWTHKNRVTKQNCLKLLRDMKM